MFSGFSWGRAAEFGVGTSLGFFLSLIVSLLISAVLGTWLRKNGHMPSILAQESALVGSGVEPDVQAKLVNKK